MAVDIDSLQIEIEATSSDAAAKVNELATALSNLKNAAKGGAGLTTVSRQLQALANAANMVNSSNVNTTKLKELTSALNSLSAVQKASGLTSTINSLKKLPDITSQLGKADMGKFATQMQQVASAMAPLANEMQKVANGFSAFPIRIQKLISSNTSLSASNQKTAKSFGVLGTGISSAQAKFGVYLLAFQQFARIASGWVSESNDYIENLNLFTVAMGEYAEEAKAYAEEVQSIMGIDSSEWMRNQGVFMQMASGFGVASDSAALMSKNLTQLGYDISSFYNIGIEEAMEKLQSGLAGEIEPLRRLGYAIDVASLEQVALKNGITESVNSMTQAERAQLRYIAIMQQSTNAMGDLSRTVQTPSNALRILNQQITQLARALGNLLLPVLQVIIPWVQAFVEVITDAIQALASLFGFELPTIDYSGMESGIGGVTSGAEDASDALGDAADAAKELNNAVLGIDELNIISPKQDSGGAGGSGGGAAGGGDLGLDLPEYDFLGGLEESVSSIKGFLEGISDEVMAIGAGLAAWKIASSVLGWFDDLKSGKFSKIDKIAAGIGLMVTGFSLEWQGGYDIGYNGPNLQNVIKTVLGSALGIAGSLLVFGTGPLGWTIGIMAAITIAIASISIGAWDAKVDDIITDRFGDIVLTDEQAQEFSEKLTTSPLSIKLDLFIDEQETLDSIKEQVESSINRLNGLNFRASIGLSVDQQEYMDAVDDFITSAEQYIQQKQVVANLAIDILLDGTETGQRLTEFTNEFYGEAYAKLNGLGGQLMNVVSTGFQDGEWIPDKLQEAIELQKEIQEVLDYISTVEFEAEMQALKLDVSGTDLTFESFSKILEQANSTIQGQMENLEAVRLEGLKVAKMEFDQNLLNGMSEREATRIYNQTVDEIQYQFEQGKVELEFGTYEFGIDTLTSAWSGEILAAQDEFNRPIQSLLDGTFQQFTTDETGVLVDSAINDFMKSVYQLWRTGFETMDVTPEVKQALSETLSALEPNAEQLQKIADDSKNAGLMVPEYVSEGLHDYNMMKAVTGDLDAINYLLGEKLSTDPNFIDALQKATDAGTQITASIAQGLLDNVEIINNANGTVSIINDTIGERVLEITPELEATFNALGVDLSEGLVNGAKNEITNSQGEIQGIGANIRTGISKGIGDMAALGWQKATDLLYGFTSKKGIDSHSPSKKFYETGLNIVSGLSNALGNVFNIGVELGQNIINGASTALQRGLQNVTSAAQNIVTSVQKVFNGVAYDPSVNYMEQINEAVASGDLERAAELETIRNAKIDGEGLDWSKTFDFSGLTGGFETVAEEYSTYVGNMSTVSQEFGLSSRNEIEVTLNSFSDALKEAGDNNEKFCNETMTMYKNMAARSNASIQSIISYLNSIPRNITTVHTIITQSVSGGSSKTKSFATGGFPDEGQMFIARESGPELVGSIGRRTAVANNSQIVESVAKGVYDAVLAAMQNGQEQGNDRPIDLKVYLDGKQIRASVKQADRQAGASIMTGGVTNR